jgi:outer membrane protein assembly factor BamB
VTSAYSAALRARLGRENRDARLLRFVRGSDAKTVTSAYSAACGSDAKIVTSAYSAALRARLGRRNCLAPSLTATSRLSENQRMTSAVQPRTTRPRLWLGLGLVLFLLVFGPWYIDTRDSRSDAARLHQLREAELFETEPIEPGRHDWPQWRGPRRDGVSQETGILTDWPKQGPKVLWKAPSGRGYASLAVANGRVYTVVQDQDVQYEVILCLDADTGQTRWRFRYPCLRIIPDHGVGPRATPTVDGDRVYTTGAGGIFHCLNALTGERLWMHDLPEEFGEGARPATLAYWGHCCSPLVEGRLVVTETRGVLGDVAAFDRDTGALVWKALADPAGYSSPVAATLAGVRQFLFFTGAGLVGLSAEDGKLLWRYPWETNDACNIATPVVADRYVFISSGYDRGCALLEISTQSDGTWRAEPVYTHKRMRCHFASPVLCHGFLYGFDNEFLACMDFRTGKIQWKQRGFAKGSLLAADGHLIILGEDGNLAVAEATPEAYRLSASFQFSHNRCWSVPVLANGKLYVRDEKQIVCYDAKHR